MAKSRPVAQSVFHPILVANGATMDEDCGWSRPVRFTSVEEEIKGVNDSVGIIDNSAVGKLKLYSDDLDTFLNKAFREVTTISTQCMKVRQFTEDSGISDILEARITGDESLFITAPMQVPTIAGVFKEVDSDCTHWVEVTSALAGITVVGPQADNLLRAVTELDISPRSFTDMSCAQVKVAEIHGTLLRRDINQLLAYELYFGREYGEYMWNAVTEAGERYKLKLFGTETLSHLRR